MKILVLRKKSSKVTWSDSLALLSEELDAKEGISVNEFLVDINIFKSIYDFFFNKFLHKKKYDIVICHHAITFYLSLPLFFFIKSSKRIFLAHEGEVHLGWKFAVLNNQILKLGSLLRYSVIWNTFPSNFFSKTFVLSKPQKKYYKNSEVVHYLGVNEKVFKSVAANKCNRGLFPSAISRPEKGWNSIPSSLKRMLVYPENLKNIEMPQLYSSSEFVIIPSVFETYSLVLIEALLCNAVIFTTKNVGLASDLLDLYGYDYLVEQGLYVASTHEEMFNLVLKFESSGHEPSTRQLAKDSFLTSSLSANTLLSKITGVLNE
ncbi:hypothetical protein [uncultured Pseudoalteromonas sp.]|uniref:hypothetical protein n=1 Tax=uncultured Pseudoalteromonas sp. TaxID=114053 RepID=UPI0025916296|nr:hypothetical protein [uncultured Pseudoalteromonas sp.]